MTFTVCEADFLRENGISFQFLVERGFRSGLWMIMFLIISCQTITVFGPRKLCSGSFPGKSSEFCPSTSLDEKFTVDFLQQLLSRLSSIAISDLEV